MLGPRACINAATDDDAAADAAAVCNTRAFRFRFTRRRLRRRVGKPRTGHENETRSTRKPRAV